MLYALTQSGQKIGAYPSGIGVCPNCRANVIAKCGELNIWHWAHQNRSDCDSWSYEPMSQWHLNWQEKFTPTNREVFISRNGEVHIADIVGKNGTIIEIQNSPISTVDIEKRELFYDDMVWVINSDKFWQNIRFKCLTIDFEKEMNSYIEPYQSEANKYLVRVPILRNSDILQSLRTNNFILCDEDDYDEELWENTQPIFNREFPPDLTKAFHKYIFDTEFLSNFSQGKNYETNFAWKHLSRTWLSAKKTRLLDLNNGFMFYIKTLYENGNGFGFIFPISKFIAKYAH